MSNRRENGRKPLGVKRLLCSSDDDDSDSQMDNPVFHRTNNDPNLHPENENEDREENEPLSVLTERAATESERAHFFNMLNRPARASPRGSIIDRDYNRPSEEFDESSPRNSKGVDLMKILSIQRVKRGMNSRNERNAPSTSNTANAEGSGRAEAPRVPVPTLSASNIIPEMLERARSMGREPQPSTSSQSAPPCPHMNPYLLTDQSDNDPCGTTMNQSILTSMRVKIENRKEEEEQLEMEVPTNVENDVNLVVSENIDAVNILAAPMKQEMEEAWDGDGEEEGEGEPEGEGEEEGEPEGEGEAEPEGDGEVEEEIDVGHEERPQPPPNVNIETQASAAPGNATQRSVQTQAAQNAPARKRRRPNPEGNYISYTVMEFNQCLLRLLECPVCLEWMEPPMWQCRRGHLVCSRCRARLSACPVCRISFSSVRNRAMEGVAELLHYPCRHGCGRGPRLRRREAHEANCAARRYACFAPDCVDHPLLPIKDLYIHMRYKHPGMVKVGKSQRFSVNTSNEVHEMWLVCADGELFQLRVDVDSRSCGLLVHLTYVGPKCNATNFTYQVTVEGRHERKIVYCREAHSDLENTSLAISRQDCFYLGLKQAHNFIRIENHGQQQRFVDFCVDIICRSVSDNSNDESSN